VEDDRDDWTHYSQTSVILCSGVDFMSGDDYYVTHPVIFLNAMNIDLCGYKLEDLDLDGVGDIGVEGWQIDLYGFEDWDSWVSNVSDMHMTVWTDASGYYCFENLNPYWIYDVYEEIRAEWTPASPIFFWSLMATGSGVDITGVNFTNARNIGLGGPGLFGYKLEDLNLDGVGDVGVEGWQIDLYGFENETAWNENDWSLHLTTTTAADGSYFFANLNPYWIYDVYEEVRDDWTSASPTYVRGLESEGSGQSIPGVNFTNARNIDICGCKYEDVNLNGYIDCEDSKVAGWDITLKVWVDGAYRWEACTQTCYFGCYCFHNLDPYKTYAVYEEYRCGWTEVITKHEGLEACGSGMDIMGQDFLNARNGDICGHKYWDKNADGIYDPCNETPLQGWTIKLYAWVCDGWVYCGQQKTDCCGCYCFENLNPYLTYKVVEMIPDGWWPVNPDDGVHCPVTFSMSGETIRNVDFLNTQCGPEGKTIGFWKTNVDKNLGYIKGKAQISATSLSTYLGAIYDKYYVGLGYEFDFLNFGGLTQTQRLQKASQILNVDDNSIMQQKAEAQILALLLTEQWKGACYSDAFVYVPACITGSTPFIGNMSGVIQEILDLYGCGEYTVAKNMADFLNNLPDSCKWGELTTTISVPSGKPKK